MLSFQYIESFQRITFYADTESSFNAGEEGFEPPAYGFGIRRSTIRTTRLQEF